MTINAPTMETPTRDDMAIPPGFEHKAPLGAARLYDEDANDVAIFDERMAALSSGEDWPCLPRCRH